MGSFLGWYVLFAISICLKQSPRVWAWFGKFSNVQQFGVTRCEADHSVLYRHSSVEVDIFTKSLRESEN